MKVRFGIQIVLLALPLVLAGAAQAEKGDLAGSADHPLVGRYQGSIISFHETKGYEELKLPRKPVERGQKDKPEEWQTALSGRLTSIRYEGPEGRSILEVMRNYKSALDTQGFRILFFCNGAKECAPGGSISTFWDAAKGRVGLPTT
ncbi:MAG: DUF4892 domain-containing protein [Bdellovibrio bacteriovorus]